MDSSPSIFGQYDLANPHHAHSKSGRLTAFHVVGTMKFEADGMTIADFFATISTLLLQQPVIDKTGLTGMFDFRLEFSRDLGLEVGGGKKGGGIRDTAPRVEAAGPSLPAALESQLGLKMAPGKGPVEFLVIDHVERPSAN